MERKEEHLNVKLKDNYKFVDFSREEYDYFCYKCMFTDLQEELLKDEIKGLSIVEMSLKHNISTSTVSRNIDKIKKKISKVL